MSLFKGFLGRKKESLTTDYTDGADKRNKFQRCGQNLRDNEYSARVVRGDTDKDILSTCHATGVIRVSQTFAGRILR
jgi:hypothetical protein